VIEKDNSVILIFVFKSHEGVFLRTEKSSFVVFLFLGKIKEVKQRILKNNSCKQEREGSHNRPGFILAAFHKRTIPWIAGCFFYFYTIEAFLRQSRVIVN